MTYSEFIEMLNAHSERDFAAFQRKLIPTPRKIIGVRTPTMRKIAKTQFLDIENLLTYPDEYYETVFIQLTAISMLGYEEFLQYLPRAVALMDNWALCDCFKAKCIRAHKENFLQVLEGLFQNGGEFFERYVLVVLLSEYTEKKYLAKIKEYISRSNTARYYVHMAVAWLTAEMLIQEYESGLELLKDRLLDVKTHNKAIQKAIESYRLSNEQKEYLRSLKIKKK